MAASLRAQIPAHACLKKLTAALPKRCKITRRSMTFRTLSALWQKVIARDASVSLSAVPNRDAGCSESASPPIDGIIGLKTAKALGLAVPQSLLVAPTR